MAAPSHRAGSARMSFRGRDDRSRASTASKWFWTCQAERHGRTPATTGRRRSCDPPEHPARETFVAKAGLLAHGSSPLPGLPGANTSDRSRQRLTAHSCGGSFGIAPAGSTEFPLSSRSEDRENLDRHTVPPGTGDVKARRLRSPGRETFRAAMPGSGANTTIAGVELGDDGEMSRAPTHAIGRASPEATAPYSTATSASMSAEARRCGRPCTTSPRIPRLCCAMNTGVSRAAFFAPRTHWRTLAGATRSRRSLKCRTSHPRPGAGREPAGSRWPPRPCVPTPRPGTASGRCCRHRPHRPSSGPRCRRSR